MDQDRRRGETREPTPQTPRTRRSHKKGGLFANPLVYLLFIFGVSAVLAAICWSAANDILALNKPERDPPVITITEEDSFGSVVNQLKDEGIIESKTLFRVFSLFAGGKKKVTPGTYQLNTEMDYHAIINGLGANSNQRMTTIVTIPEGYNIDQIFKLLEEEGVSTQKKLQDIAAQHNYAFSFLQEIPLGDYHRLEGYLFPDTYEFTMGEDARYVINKMLLNFDQKVTDVMRQKIADMGYSVRDIVVIASMIEKETDGTDRANISSVIRNRLNKPGETQGFLQIDATIQYVLPKGEKVTTAHYKGVDSPYNTYQHKGLPPGPIANPGMESILAAMNPADTKYYYYALGTDGLHHFFRTLAEHEAFLRS